MSALTVVGIAALLASRRNLRAGDRVEPLIAGVRVEVTVLERIEGEYGSVRYRCVDDNGKEHEIWSMDDPRRV